MLSHTTTRPTLARSLHQQVLINSSTLSTSALSDSLPQPSTTPTAFGSSCILASFRQPSAAPDNPASLSTAFGSLRSLQQPSAVSASLRSLTFDFTFTSQCSHRLNSGRTSYKHSDAPTRFPLTNGIPHDPLRTITDRCYKPSSIPQPISHSPA